MLINTPKAEVSREHSLTDTLCVKLRNENLLTRNGRYEELMLRPLKTRTTSLLYLPQLSISSANCSHSWSSNDEAIFDVRLHGRLYLQCTISTYIIHTLRNISRHAIRARKSRFANTSFSQALSAQQKI